LTKSFRPLSR